MSRRVGIAGGLEAGHIIQAGVMAGTTVIGPVVTDVRDVDGIGYDITWTGAAVGAIKVEVSNSYVPNLTIGAAAPIRAGNWTDVTSLLTPAITQPNNNARTIFVGLAHTLSVMEAKFVRISYTNASSTGVLDVWMHGKSLGD